MPTIENALGTKPKTLSKPNHTDPQDRSWQAEKRELVIQAPTQDRFVQESLKDSKEAEDAANQSADEQQIQ